MTNNINRWLLAFAAAYLFLLPTNAATFVRSVTFGGAGLCAVIVYAQNARNAATRVPLAGPAILVTLFAWSAWSWLSLAWSVDREYSESQLEREVIDSLLAMLIFYVAARDARSLRVLIAAALSGFALFGILAIGMAAVLGTWDAGRWHQGVGPWSTGLVLVAPLMLAFVAPPPVGFPRTKTNAAAAAALVVVMVITARMTDNRAVWVAFAAVVVTASLLAALRWRGRLARAPLRWATPVVLVLLLLGVAFVDVLEKRADVVSPSSLAESIERDPRIILWEHIRDRIRERPLLGYGFGKRILAEPLAAELNDPLLAHSHNLFASQWLQTGLIGMVTFCAFLVALAWRYIRFVCSRDDTLFFLGVVGLSLMVGFIVKNLTDDFLFRSNAKELWAMTAFLLGFGVRRERMRASGDVPSGECAGDAAELRPHAQADGEISGGAAPATAAAPPPPQRQSESA